MQKMTNAKNFLLCENQADKQTFWVLVFITMYVFLLINKIAV